MRIIHRQRIQVFATAHPDSHPSLNAWTQAMEQNNFAYFHQLRQTFGSVDYVRPYTVFNISGNKYRLITLINYTLGLASVERVLTHGEYDREQWKI